MLKQNISKIISQQNTENISFKMKDSSPYRGRLEAGT
jgi:hypothetical protein